MHERHGIARSVCASEIDVRSTYLYLGGVGGPSMSPTELAGTSFFGTVVFGAGDLDGDGHADVLVGAPGTGSSPIGSVDIFLGTSSGLQLVPIALTGFNGYGFAHLRNAPSKHRTLPG